MCPEKRAKLTLTSKQASVGSVWGRACCGVYRVIGASSGSRGGHESRRVPRPAHWTGPGAFEPPATADGSSSVLREQVSSSQGLPTTSPRAPDSSSPSGLGLDRPFEDVVPVRETRSSGSGEPDPCCSVIEPQRVGGADEMRSDDGGPTEPIPGIECPGAGQLASPIRGHRMRVRRWRHSWSRALTIAADQAEPSPQQVGAARV